MLLETPILDSSPLETLQEKVTEVAGLTHPGTDLNSFRAFCTEFETQLIRILPPYTYIFHIRRACHRYNHTLSSENRYAADLLR